MKHRYTEQQLRNAIANSISIRQALVFLNISPHGGNYKVIQKAITKYSIDVSHFTGQSHAKGKTIAPRTDILDYLENNKPIGSFRLKNRLIKENILKPICSSCKQTSWLDNPIPLELDHINGDSSNNLIENLRLLCPNCHALTPTYRGKNQKRARV